MKTIVLTLSIAVAIISNSKGQAYQNFPNDSAFWIYRHEAHPNIFCYSDRYEMVGDTIIYGNKWFKLFYQTTTYVDNFNTCNNPYSTNKLMGYIRNDSIHKKVYYKDVASGYSDTLLYDFSIVRNVNDTFLQKTREGDTIMYVVEQIDSVQKYTANPNVYKFVKRYYLAAQNPNSGYSCQVFLVDGEGYGNGVIPSNDGTYGCFEYSLYLDIFCSKDCSDPWCQNYILLNTKDVAKDVIINLSPNPTTHTLNIYAPQATQLIIYNLLGSVIQTIYTSTETATINTSNLANGIYFIKTNTGQVAKFIKE